MASSPYFRAMFSSGMREAQSGEIKLKNMTPETAELVMGFVYTENDIVTQGNVETILEAASLLQIKTLFEKCENFLVETMSVEKCLDYWWLPYLDSCQKVKASAIQHILDNFMESKSMEAFMQLTHNELLGLVKDDRLKVTSEEVVVKTVLKWVSDSKDAKRKSDLGEMFANIRLI